MEWKERHNTISRGGNTTVMVGRQRDPNRNHLAQRMARLIRTVNKYGYCRVGMLTGDSEARQYRVHIMHIAHPDADGVVEHMFEEIRLTAGATRRMRG
jgi:hypothetical protein